MFPMANRLDIVGIIVRIIKLKSAFLELSPPNERDWKGPLCTSDSDMGSLIATCSIAFRMVCSSDQWPSASSYCSPDTWPCSLTCRPFCTPCPTSVTSGTPSRGSSSACTATAEVLSIARSQSTTTATTDTLRGSSKS